MARKNSSQIAIIAIFAIVAIVILSEFTFTGYASASMFRDILKGGAPPQQPPRFSYCGDGYCDIDENFFTCPQDCHVGNGICEPEYGENNNNAPADCFCGDHVCDKINENPTNCNLDCYICGDGKCTPPAEGWSNCPSECPVCGDGYCEDIEIYADFNHSCIADCGAVIGDGRCGDVFISGQPETANFSRDCAKCGDGICTVEDEGWIEDCDSDCYCIDSDGVDIYTRGTCTDAWHKYTDVCNGNVVVEFYCSKYYPKSKINTCYYKYIKCPGICKNGVCVPGPPIMQVKLSNKSLTYKENLITS